jgi:arogenate dehydrogenase (NADP+)
MTTFSDEHPVGLVGLGLIGGSLGLDLLARGIEVRALVHRQATLERARQRGLATQISTDPAVLAGCGIVVLALPLDRLLDPAPELLQALPHDAVITDVGSVKAPVLARWHRRVTRFVAGHPMAGTAAAGVEAGQRDLFRGRPWVATPLADTDPTAVAAVRALAGDLGARWLECGAEAHDRAVALISHLPVLVSAALLRAAEEGASGRGGPGTVAAEEVELPALVRALASSGFADTTRVGGGNPELGTLMARSNRSALREALTAYRASLERLEDLVERECWPELSAELGHCRDLRPEFL